MSTVLVTGASSGIGAATAEALLERGHTVYVAARRLEKMKPLEERGAHALRMDITEEAEVEAAVEAVEDGHGGVDVLVNNAGFGLYGPVEETSLDDARYQFEVNLFGLAHLTKLVLPGMRARGSGTIVNVSSMGGKVYTPLGAWYHATKHALEGWSDCLRLEVEPHGVRVVIVEPGIIHTEFGEVMDDSIPEEATRGPYADITRRTREAAREAYQGGRGSPPSEVGRVIARAVEARNPKPRYVVGALARPLLLARWLLTDRMFDRLVISQY